MTTNEVGEGHVSSRDGTRIVYTYRGRGPGLVLVQGAMATARHYAELAQALAPTFTVLAPDRRGRGMSPKPYNPGHDIARDVEDVDALLAETGATRVFGLSSGAMITLEAARTLPRVSLAAVYEPPFYPDGISYEGIRQLGAEIERGDLSSALLDALDLSGTLPRPIRALPRPIARLLARAVLSTDSRLPGRRARLRDLLPGIRYDFHDVAGLDGRMQTFATVEKPVLLISGTKSPTYLRRSTLALASVLPQPRHVELDGLSHSGPWNASRGGRPRPVAATLQDFFT